MTIKLGRIYILIFIICTFLWTQKASMISQKITIENSFQQKISAAVSSLLGEEKFLVIVSIEFSTIGGVIKKTSEPLSGINNQGTYIPGIPTIPSSENSISYGNKSKKNNENNLEVGRVDVIVGISEASIDGSIKQEIKSLVETVVPQTKNCEDCIKIQAMKFQSDKKNDEIENLKKQIDELQAQIRQSKLDTDATLLKNLEQQLANAKTKIQSAETITQNRELQRLEEEKIRFNQLIASERERKKQDSIRFINTEERLERVMESKIKSDSIIIREAMGIMKQQALGESSDESLLGMQVGSGSSSIMSYVLIIFLIISLMVVTFLAANNKKPKTIYLKPKEPIKGKKKDTKVSEKSKKIEDDTETKKTENTEVKESTEPKPPIIPRPDEDAMRPELKSLRQTAVSLTVGEREGASALIKEWLEDNPNKESENSGEGGEE